MAQVTLRVLFLTLAFCLAVPVLAQEVPDAGLAAEGEGRWDDALRIYRQTLEREPERADLWLRMADIYAVRKNRPDEAAKATAEAARLRPNDARLQRRLSQAHAINNQPDEALQAIRRARELDPDNEEYRQAEAELVAWQAGTASRPGSAERRQAYELGIAGDLEASSDRYRAYTSTHPDDADALLEWAAVETYRGNYGKAEELQQRYYAKAGDTQAYRKSRANLLARSGRPNEALRLVEPMLQQSPNDYDLHLIHTLALQESRRPRAARDSLATLERLGPSRPETRGAQLVVGTPLKTEMPFGADYYDDSSDIRIARAYWGMAFSPSPESRIGFNLSHMQLRAPNGSGFEPVTGSRRVDLDRAVARFSWQFPDFYMEYALGHARNDRSDDAVIGGMLFDVWPNDRLKIRTLIEHDVLDVSPRTVDFFIKRSGLRLFLDHHATHRTFYRWMLGYDDYDDGNRRYEALFEPYWATARTQHVNNDIGLRAQWLRYERSLPNGYYDPQEFWRLWLLNSLYWKFNDNDGLGLFIGLGPEYDPALDSHVELGGDISIEGTFGVYRDWQVKFRAAHAARTGNPIGAGNFNGSSIGFEVLYRF